MNATLLLKVKDRILREPENFAMRSWQCGTTACIGGWACLLSSKFAMYRGDDYETDAIAALGITEDDAGKLFFVDHWPEDLRRKYWHATSKKEEAQVAAERIDRFLAEKCPYFKKGLEEDERYVTT